MSQLVRMGAGASLGDEREPLARALVDEIRETIYEDELAGEPRWDDMIEALAEAGIAAREADLEALPFVVELDEELSASLRSPRSTRHPRA